MITEQALLVGAALKYALVVLLSPGPRDGALLLLLSGVALGASLVSAIWYFAQ